MSKQFVIVGGSKGIGFAIVQRLLSEGNQVTVLSRTAEALESLDGVTHIPWDASSEDLPADQLPESIDGLVYCPGSLNLRSFKSLKPEVFQEDFQLNVVGAIKTIQGCLKGMKSAGKSSVLMFSTVAVGQGMFAHASIAASKGAIEGLTRTIAAELAPNVRVNCVAPALTNTPLTSKFFATEEKANAMAEKYPLGRAGTVDDMANAAMFLLSDESSWITGQVLGVDGGMSTLRK
ncbi:MAG: SDR family oxidoreductase [Planctomycetota bacterium]